MSSSHNLLNINNAATTKLNKSNNRTIHNYDLSIEDTGHKLITKVFKLDSQGDSNQKLASALHKIVEVNGDCDEIQLNGNDSASEILTKVGKYIHDKQETKKEKLSEKDIELLQNLCIVLKVARRINDNNNEYKTIKFNCFSDFERHNRYEYSQNLNIEENKHRNGKDATSWTSFFKDALAFNAKEQGKDDLEDIFKAGKVLSVADEHRDLLIKFNSSTDEYKDELKQFWGQRASGVTMAKDATIPNVGEDAFNKPPNTYDRNSSQNDSQRHEKDADLRGGSSDPDGTDPAARVTANTGSSSDPDGSTTGSSDGSSVRPVAPNTGSDGENNLNAAGGRLANLFG
ncbi:MAG: hypothetical protein VW397_07920, partial [Candidatus Margulisiibacteriota bacterium]